MEGDYGLVRVVRSTCRLFVARDGPGTSRYWGFAATSLAPSAALDGIGLLELGWNGLTIMLESHPVANGGLAVACQSEVVSGKGRFDSPSAGASMQSSKTWSSSVFLVSPAINRVVVDCGRVVPFFSGPCRYSRNARRAVSSSVIKPTMAERAARHLS